MLMEVEVEQSVHAFVDLEDDVAAATPVTAVGTAEGFELLSVDRGAAVATLAGADVQHYPVDEAGHGGPLSERNYR